MKDTCPPQTSPPTSSTSEQSEQTATSEQDQYGNAFVMEQTACSSADPSEGTFFDRLVAGTTIKTAFPFNAAFPVLGNNVTLETEVEAGLNPGTLKAKKFKLTVGATKQAIDDKRSKEQKEIDEASPRGAELATHDVPLANFVVEMSNEEEFSLDKLGVDIPGLGNAAISDQGVKGGISQAFGPVSVGLDFDGTKDPWKTSLDLGFDAFEVLFGGGLRKAKETAKEQNIDFALGANFKTKLDLLDGGSLDMRIENIKAELEASVGTLVPGEATGCGEFGAKAGVKVGMETDYAEGTAEDPWSKTTGTASTSLTVTLFGQNFGVDLSGERSASGTYLEASQAQKRLNEIALEAAYGQTFKDITSTKGIDQRRIVRSLMSDLKTSYEAADEQLKSATGVSPMSDYGYGPATEIYSENSRENRFMVVDWHDQVRAVIARNERAKMIHEWLVYKGGGTATGEYASSGWSGAVTLSMTSDTDFEGDYGSDGTLLGTINGQTMTGVWSESGGTRQGAFTLQIQEDGDRLYGNYEVDDEPREWIMERKSG